MRSKLWGATPVRRAALGTTVLGGALAAAALATATPAASAAAKQSGNVDVIAAGSLDTVLTTKIDPAFHAATGYTVVATTGGSGTDAADIKNKVDVEDVFISAAAADDKLLMGASNGGWVSWYASFAASPEVLAYNPKSKFAKDLKSMPWYKVVTMPGFRLGRTNPSQDPGGVLAREALLQTAKAQKLPALKKLASESSDEYSEDTEQAGIQNGQLDASFMYEADAISQKSPFVKLTGVNLAGDYTVTLLNHAPHTAAAEAFIKFLLGHTAQQQMKADQFQIVSPAKRSGSGVPSALDSVIK